MNTRYYADCRDCSWNRIGMNEEPVKAGGWAHEDEHGHTVEFDCSPGDDED